MTTREELLKILDGCEEVVSYTECPACGEDACWQNVSEMDNGRGDIHEVLMCRLCGYIRESLFGADGSVMADTPRVGALYFIRYWTGAGQFGHVMGEVNKAGLLWFKGIMEDPNVNRDESYLKILHLGTT